MAHWPDVADATSMLVAIAGPNAGSPTAGALCAEACAPALWQMLPGSALLAALDEAWDPGAIPVTAIRSLQDEFVPPESAAAIPGATVITVQDHCPGRPVSHAGLLADPVAYAAVASALAGGGTPDPAALDGVGCEQTTVAGMDMAALDAAAAASLTAVLGAETVPAKPAVTLAVPGGGA